MLIDLDLVRAFISMRCFYRFGKGNIIGTGSSICNCLKNYWPALWNHRVKSHSTIYYVQILDVRSPRLPWSRNTVRNRGSERAMDPKFNASISLRSWVRLKSPSSTLLAVSGNISTFYKAYKRRNFHAWCLWSSEKQLMIIYAKMPTFI